MNKWINYSESDKKRCRDYESRKIFAILKDLNLLLDVSNKYSNEWYCGEQPIESEKIKPAGMASY